MPGSPKGGLRKARGVKESSHCLSLWPRALEFLTSACIRGSGFKAWPPERGSLGSDLLVHLLVVRFGPSPCPSLALSLPLRDTECPRSEVFAPDVHFVQEGTEDGAHSTDPSPRPGCFPGRPREGQHWPAATQPPNRTLPPSEALPRCPPPLARLLASGLLSAPGRLSVWRGPRNM